MDLLVTGVHHIGGVLLQQQAVAQVLLDLVEGGNRRGRLVATAQDLQALVGEHAVADAQLVFGDQVLDAPDLLIHRTGGDQPQHVRDLHRVVGALLVLIRQAEQGEAGRCRVGLPLGLDGRQLDLLHVTDLVTGFVTEDDHRDRRSQAEHRGDGERTAGKAQVALLQQVERRDRQHEDRPGDIAGRHRVDELDLCHRVEQQRAEVHQFHAHGLEVELRAHRVLHPAISDKDPERREIRAQRHQPGDR